MIVQRPWTARELWQIEMDDEEGCSDYLSFLNLLASRMAEERQRWEKIRGDRPVEGTFAIDFDMAKVALSMPGISWSLLRHATSEAPPNAP